MPIAPRHYLDPRTLTVACDARGALNATPAVQGVTCPQCQRRLGQMPESALLRAVREVARAKGWLSYHTFRSDKSEKGFVDVVLCKPGHVMACIELKTARGKLTCEQAMWRQAMEQATGMAYFLWRPTDLPQISGILDTLKGDHYDPPRTL